MKPLKGNELSLWNLWLPLVAVLAVVILFGLFEFAHFTYAYIIPVTILVAYYYFFAFRKFVWFMILLTPLSISLRDVGGGLGVSLPMEPMVFAVFIGGIIVAIREKILHRNFFTHTVTLLVLLQIGWLAITVPGSSYTTVSVKLLISRVVYVFVFYVLLGTMFRDIKNIYNYLGLYILGFIPVIIYSLYKIGQYGFSQAYSPAMSEPFYDDHTIFGACIAMLIPPVWLVWRSARNSNEVPRFIRTFGLPVLIFLIFGVIFSYSRAAWLSLIVAWGVWVVYRMRLGPGIIVTAIVLMVSGILLFKGEIYQSMKDREKIDNSTLIGHASTVTDLERDESNLERINRWSCAVRMYRERPVWGFGPGTYERNYGKFQVTSELTRISTYNGDRGDAHSDYLTVLSEQGFTGLILWFLLLISLIVTGMRVAYKAPQEHVRMLAIGVLLGLFTFIAHVAVNSFLDMEKSSILFWGFAATLVCLDIFYVHPTRKKVDSRNSGLSQ